MSNLGKWFARLVAASSAGLVIGAMAAPAFAQVPRVRAKAPRAVPAAPAVPAATDEVPAATEPAREATRDAAKAARETTDEVRDTARDAKRDVREAGREGREAVRETREGVRETRRDVRDLTNSRAADYGLWFNTGARADGLVIADIAAQGAISKIGFREGDRIVSVNGQRVGSEADFMRYILADDLRTQRVKVIVLRDRREEIVYIQPSILVTEVTDYDPLWRYGIVLDDRVTDRIVITRVYPRTPAYYAGLRSGDVVVGLRGQRIGAVADLVSAFTNADGRVALQVSRGDRTRDLEIDATTETRTSLKPSVDAEGRVEGRADLPADQQPRPDKPDLNRPRTDKPDLDRPRTEKPELDRPDLDKPRIEKPRINKPEADLDAPRADKPRIEKPATPATPEIPDAPAAPAVKPTAPAAPVAPATPAVPEAPKLP